MKNTIVTIEIHNGYPFKATIVGEYIKAERIPNMTDREAAKSGRNPGDPGTFTIIPITYFIVIDTERRTLHHINPKYIIAAQTPRN